MTPNDQNFHCLVLYESHFLIYIMIILEKAIIWLKNYRRFKKVHHSISIYLQHQVNFGRKSRLTPHCNSEPNPALQSNVSQRSSVFMAKDKLVSFTQSLTKSRTFDNGKFKSSSIHKKWPKWRTKSTDLPSIPLPSSPGKVSESSSVEARVIIFKKI